MTDDEALIALRNIEQDTAERLGRVGIKTVSQLRMEGAVIAYCKLKIRFPETTSKMLISLQAALLGVDWRELPATLKDEIKREAWDILRDYKKTNRDQAKANAEK